MSVEALEFILDLSDISHVDFDIDDADEQDFAPIAEFICMSVLLLCQQLRA